MNYMKMKKDKIEEALFDCYRELYKHSTPSADYQELIDNAEVDSRGQRVINVRDYEIHPDDYDLIIENIFKKHKISKSIQQTFKSTIQLGCSPKFKK